MRMSGWSNQPYPSYPSGGGGAPSGMPMPDFSGGPYQPSGEAPNWNVPMHQYGGANTNQPYPPQSGQSQGYPGQNQPSYPPMPHQNASAPASGGYNRSYPSAGSTQQSYNTYPQQPAYNPGYPSAPTQQPSYPAQQPAYPSAPTGGAYPSYPGQSQQSAYPQLPGSGYPPSQQPQQLQKQQQQYGQSYPGPPQPGYNQPQQTMAQQAASPLQLDEPTLRPKSNFDAEADCKALHKAMKGLGTDEKAIIDILASRSGTQRLQLVQVYKTMYGKDLLSQLQSELSGNFEDAVIALLLPAAAFDAISLHDAIAGLGTDEETLIEIICSRTNTELSAIKQAYGAYYRQNLEQDIAGDTSGYFKRILIACLTGGRQEGANVDINKARADAKDLLEAGPKKWGTDEAAFIAIFALRSHAQLRAAFDEFRKMSNHDIERMLQSELSGDLLDSMLTLAKMVKNKHAYFAERLYKSMAGAGTRDKQLIRVVVSRCEKDMGNIRKEFLRMYGKTVESFISGDCSGDYKKILLALVNPGAR